MKKLIGMEAIHKELSNIFENKELYKHRLTMPAHFMVELEPGNGQTALAEYITDFFQENQIRHFGGRDTYLEYMVDGSMAQLRWMFADIKASAVYTNEFEGIVAMDISMLASKVNEAQMSYFLNEIKRISTNVTFIFFVSEEKSRNQEQIIKKVCSVLNQVKFFPAMGYQTEELAEIAIEGLLEKSVRIENKEETRLVLADYIQESQISTAKQAVELAGKAAHFVDFAGGLPVLSASRLKKGLCPEKMAVMGGK